MNGLFLENGLVAAGSFDLDGNVLHTLTEHNFVHKETGIVYTFLGQEIDQKPEDFFGNSAIYAFENNDIEQSFRRSRDVSSYDNHLGFEQLLVDFKKTLEGDNLGPSFSVFQEMFLLKGRIASILTARGHSPDNLQRCIQFLNGETLTPNQKREQLDAIRDNFYLGRDITDIQVLDYYFGIVLDYIPVNNNQVSKFLNLSPFNTAFRKANAMEWYIQEVKNKLHSLKMRSGNFETPTPIAFGFSDDTASNVIAMSKHFSTPEKNTLFQSGDKLRTYYTGALSHFEKIRGALGDIVDMKDISGNDKSILQIRLKNQKELISV